MPRTKLMRRSATPLAPFLPRPIFPSLFTPLPKSLEEFSERADEMFRSAFAGLPEFPTQQWFPAINVSEGKEAYVVTAELPGLSAKEVNVEYADGVLYISGEKSKEEETKEDGLKYYVWERSFGSFQRSFPMPGIMDSKIEAEFKDGVLKVTLPKSEEAKAKRRPISVVTK
jgi:HSP20 family protein